MSFHFNGLAPNQFAPLFELSDTDLAVQNIVKMTADTQPGFPCRVSLQEAQLNDTVLLLNFDHLDVASPYAARHAIFVAQSSRPTPLDVDAIPEVISNRLVSLRAFDQNDHIIDADVAEGSDARAVLERMFADPATCYVDTHAAKRGCFLARATRA